MSIFSWSFSLRLDAFLNCAPFALHVLCLISDHLSDPLENTHPPLSQPMKERTPLIHTRKAIAEQINQQGL